MRETLVIDASVAVKWVVGEEGAARAVALRSSFAFAAPELILPECANILWKKAQRGELARAEAILAAKLLERSGVDFVSLQGLRPVRLSGTENRHKAVQKSHAEVGFLSGLRPPLITVSGSEKSYRPRKLRWRQISGERWGMSSLLTSMPSDLTWRMASCM